MMRYLKVYKDIFLLLDSDSKRVELGGLSFSADNISVTKSNISWSAKNLEIYRALLNKFPDAELLDVKLENEGDNND